MKQIIIVLIYLSSVPLLSMHSDPLPDFNRSYKLLLDEQHRGQLPLKVNVKLVAMRPYIVALRESILRDDLRQADFLLSRAPFIEHWYELNTPNWPDYGNDCARLLAVMKGNVEMVKLLFAIHPDVRGDCGRPVYHDGNTQPRYYLNEALNCNHLEVAKLLLNAQKELGAPRNADPHQRDFCGETPLIIARKKHFNLSAKNTPADELKAWAEMIDLLEGHRP
jgi:hypothetical protein